MRGLAFLASIINVAVFCTAFGMFGVTIKQGSNPLVWFVIMIAFLVTLVWLACYALQLPHGESRSHG
jgi:hypothetical protein